MVKASCSERVLQNLLVNFDAALDGLHTDALGLMLDFDGTLSNFADVPDDAVIYPDVIEPLVELVESLDFVCVISGRAVRDLTERVGIKGIGYIGNHGAEFCIDGVIEVVEEACGESDLQAIIDGLARAADDAGVICENKGFSASVHYRQSANETKVVERLKSALANILDTGELDASGLEVFWGNKLLELRRSGGMNKGRALDRLIHKYGLRNVIYLGDDTTDADAMRTLMARRKTGVICGFGVAVIQEGTPQSVLESADYSLKGVGEVAEFLRRLNEAR